jgi:hypothetical protein
VPRAQENQKNSHHGGHEGKTKTRKRKIELKGVSVREPLPPIFAAMDHQQFNGFSLSIFS